MARLAFAVVLLAASAAAAQGADACQRGDAEACVSQGRLAAVVGHYADMMAYYTRACDLGLMSACNDIGTFYQHGRGVAKDDSVAVRFYEQACDGNDATGCFNLAWMLLKGRGAEANPPRGAALYRWACDHGEPRGCTNLAVAFRDGTGVPKNTDKAIHYAELGCKGAIPEACNVLAWLIEDHAHGDEDRSRAARFFDKACSLGHAESCYQLAVRLLQGQGMPGTQRDPDRLLTSACPDVPASCYVLGARLEAQGKHESAREHYDLACQEGYKPACYHLSRSQPAK